MDHAHTIAQEKVPDPRYGIFALRSVAGDYEIIMHVNHANLPGPKGSTLRVLWSLVAPKYDVEYVEDYDLTTIIVNVMIGIVKLGSNDMRSRFIKLHLGSMVDRGVISGFALTLESVGYVSDTAIRGNWLHMTFVQS